METVKTSDVKVEGGAGSGAEETDELEHLLGLQVGCVTKDVVPSEPIRCKCCFTKIADTFFLPCKHLCTCYCFILVVMYRHTFFIHRRV